MDNPLRKIGIVRCPVISLVPYAIESRRQLSEKHVEQLSQVFDEHYDTNNEDYFVEAIVTPKNLAEILENLQLSKKNLHQTLRLCNTPGGLGKYPTLTNIPIAYIEGRHRIEALRSSATKFIGVVLLSVRGEWIEFPTKLGLPEPDQAQIQSRLTQYSHKSRYSDGDVYKMVRQCEVEYDRDKWLCRLSKAKRKALGTLLKNHKITEAFDKLMEFPGVIAGLQLGNIHRHLALHIDEELLCYLEYIYKTWDCILQIDNCPPPKSLVDLASVTKLQRLAPASRKDAQDIKDMFQDLFPAIKDPIARKKLQDNVLSISTMIPSLVTFHENMKYISIGAKILRENLAPKSLRGTTLFRCLTQKDYWKAPKRSYMEIGKGNFVVLSSPIIEESYLHYKQLFLAALRHFTELSTESALQDIREEKIPARELKETKTYLNRLALCVGFDNPKIQKIRDNPSGEKRGPEYSLRKATSVEWRSGIPFTRTYLELESTGFLHRIKHWPQGMAATPLLVFSDIINGFFRTTPFERDLSLPGMAFEGPTGGAIRDHIHFNRQSGTRCVAPNRLPISVILPGQPSVRKSQVAENAANRQIIQRQGSQAIKQNGAALGPIASPALSFASVSDGEAGITINTLTLPGPAGIIMGTESYDAADPCTELVQAGNLPPARISLDPNLNAKPAQASFVTLGPTTAYFNNLENPGSSLTPPSDRTTIAASPILENMQAANIRNWRGNHDVLEPTLQTISNKHVSSIQTTARQISPNAPTNIMEISTRKANGKLRKLSKANRRNEQLRHFPGYISPTSWRVGQDSNEGVLGAEQSEDTAMYDRQETDQIEDIAMNDRPEAERSQSFSTSPRPRVLCGSENRGRSKSRTDDRNRLRAGSNRRENNRDRDRSRSCCNDHRENNRKGGRRDGGRYRSRSSAQRDHMNQHGLEIERDGGRDSRPKARKVDKRPQPIFEDPDSSDSESLIGSVPLLLGPTVEEALDVPATQLELQISLQRRQGKTGNSSQDQRIIRPWIDQDISGPIRTIYRQFSEQQTHPRADSSHRPERTRIQEIPPSHILKFIEWYEPDNAAQMQLQPLGSQTQPKPNAYSVQQEAVQAVPELPAGLATEVAVPPPEGPNSNGAAKEASKQNNVLAVVKTLETGSSAPDDVSFGAEGVQETPREVNHNLSTTEQVRKKHSLPAEEVQIRSAEIGRAVKRQRRHGMMLDFGLAPNRNESPGGSSEPDKPPEHGKRETYESMHQSQDIQTTARRAAESGDFAQTKRDWRDTASSHSSKSTL